jgi:hypothetical protein
MPQNGVPLGYRKLSCLVASAQFNPWESNPGHNHVQSLIDDGDKGCERS